MMLEREGYEVEVVGDVDTAKERLNSHPFDLLIADVHMPGNDKLELLHTRVPVPVLVVTGDPSVDTAVAALRSAAVDYVVKPLAPEDFLARVAAGVARGESLRRLDLVERQLQEQLRILAGVRATLQPEIAAGEALGWGKHAGPDRRPLPEAVVEALSLREQEVLLAFRDNPKLKVVASRLRISTNTVKNHFKSIYRKLDVSSQAELLSLLHG